MRVMLRLLLGVGLCALGACEKQGKPTPEPEGSLASRARSLQPQASRPQAAHGPRPALNPACFDVYAECEPTIGLPAVSPDGTRVAVPGFGPVSPRDEFTLTMRIVGVDDGAVIAASPIITPQDYLRADTGELSDAQRAQAAARARDFENTLAQERYVPLTRLGVVHEQRASDDVDGMRASFDGKELTIVATRTGRVLWQRSVGPSSTAGDCGSLPVAEIAVWASRAHRVAVARVSYISPDSCEADEPYLIWR